MDQIGEIAGQNNSESITEYEFEDVSRNTVYYRLKMVDYDGSFEYSKSLVARNNSMTTQVYPNPSNTGVFTVEAEDAHNVLVNVSDMSGLTISSTTLTNNHTIDLSAFDNGVYLLTIIADGKMDHQRVLINK